MTMRVSQVGRYRLLWPNGSTPDDPNGDQRTRVAKHGQPTPAPTEQKRHKRETKTPNDARRRPTWPWQSANGDLSQKITVDVRDFNLRETINTMVDQLCAAFASEVTRVAHARSAPKAISAGAGGSEGMAWHVEGPDRECQHNGCRGAQHRDGGHRKWPRAICRARSQWMSKAKFYNSRNTINTMVDQLTTASPQRSRAWHARSAIEASPAARPSHGSYGGYMEGPDREGQLDGFEPDRASARCIAEVADGKSRKATCRARSQRVGPCQRRDSGTQKEPSITMVDQLSNCFASRRSAAWHARPTPKASSAARRSSRMSCGPWKDLTENVNSMAANLTAQVRNIAEGGHSSGEGRLVAQDHTGCQRSNFCNYKNNQHHGRTNSTTFSSEVTCVAARSAPKASSAARAMVKDVGGHLEGSDREGQLMAVQFHRAGA